jgi:hypothetical protein
MCWGQSIPEPAAKLEEPQQALEEERPAQHTGGQQAVLGNSYVPSVETGQLLDNGETQLDREKDDLKTDEFRFWGSRPYHGRRWGGWGWYGYPSWGWGWNGYRGWSGYDYGRRYPYYGYYW